jgi:hypothetical protein
LNVKLNLATSAVLCLFSVALGACSKLAAPLPGHYRGAIELKGGEAPVQLQIARQNGQVQLSLLNGDATVNATQVSVQNDELHAVLPNHVGELQATFTSKGLTGEWRLVDTQGKATKLAFTARLGAQYRFIDKPTTDNADVTGYWQLDQSVQLTAQQASASAMPIVLNLRQTHDAVDGVLTVSDSEQLKLCGQVHGDDVYLSAIGAGQIVLFKGKVNSHGDLEGKLWLNSSEARPWTAKRTLDQPTIDAVGDGARQVAFPSAVQLP